MNTLSLHPGCYLFSFQIRYFPLAVATWSDLSVQVPKRGQNVARRWRRPVRSTCIYVSFFSGSKEKIKEEYSSLHSQQHLESLFPSPRLLLLMGEWDVDEWDVDEWDVDALIAAVGVRYWHKVLKSGFTSKGTCTVNNYRFVITWRLSFFHPLGITRVVCTSVN